VPHDIITKRQHKFSAKTTLKSRHPFAQQSKTRFSVSVAISISTSQQNNSTKQASSPQSETRTQLCLKQFSNSMTTKSSISMATINKIRISKHQQKSKSYACISILQNLNESQASA
jgi:N-acetyl-anhydromuramyl-L-alanine amidase AmpD